MSEGRYSPASWDHADGSETHHSSNHVYTPGQPVGSHESLDANGTVPPTPTKSTSPPRSSTESPTQLSAQRWRERALTPPAEAPDSVTVDSATLVEPSFDENVLRALCDLDCGIPLLLDRIKQSMVSCREAANFFKKRALLEEEYGRGMQRLAKATSDAYSASDGKAGTFVAAWHSALKIHEQIADNRLRFSQRLNEMSQELSTLAKEVDYSRKQTKELANRYEKNLQESETATEKCKVRVDVTAEELERLLLQKEGESMKDSQLQGRTPGGASGKRVIGKAVAKGGMLLKGRNPGNLQRQEEDVRARMSKESDAYRKAVTETQAIRQEYFNFQYPRLLRALKECVDEIDLGTQYHLSRYAFLCESIVLSDGTTLTPVDDTATLPGLKTSLESIDNRSDFKTYMQNYAFAHGGANSRGPRRDGPREEGFLPPIAALAPPHAASSPSASNTQIPDRGRPTFGVDLAEQMARDDVDVPAIMARCCEAIEKYGLQSQGIYRIGGTMTKVAKLKERLDRDLDSVNLDAEEWSSDISNVTSVLKMWLRELPDPLLTTQLHSAFLEAARNDNERLRHIRLHERVNDLPDANYSTLKYFMGHLHKIVEHEAENAMSVQNIAIVFGPTLFGQMVPGMNGQLNGMADASLQNKAIETILEHYTDIFVDENES
ncbi:GTPase activating protein [Fomitopsis serialis]|uniref:GTPase activating protein n=1 Tax=Fomitopsis serialis TaxID=139415 RepID=UPI0020073947|nr:GTPase activating protein [Neoantrodia serialis]KAH9931810.1 GTPase activating protein [Neoantrodia serialis]